MDVWNKEYNLQKQVMDLNDKVDSMNRRLDEMLNTPYMQMNLMLLVITLKILYDILRFL